MLLMSAVTDSDDTLALFLRTGFIFLLYIQSDFGNGTFSSKRNTSNLAASIRYNLLFVALSAMSITAGTGEMLLLGTGAVLICCVVISALNMLSEESQEGSQSDNQYNSDGDGSDCDGDSESFSNNDLDLEGSGMQKWDTGAILEDAEGLSSPLRLSREDAFACVMGALQVRGYL